MPAKKTKKQQKSNKKAKVPNRSQQLTESTALSGFRFGEHRTEIRYP
jgi:hypothetical protein